MYIFHVSVIVGETDIQLPVDYDVKVFNLKILLFRDEKYRHALVKIIKYSQICLCSHFY